MHTCKSSVDDPELESRLQEVSSEFRLSHWGNAGTGQLVALQDMDAIVLGSALSNGIRDSKTTHSYMVL